MRYFLVSVLVSSILLTLSASYGFTIIIDPAHGGSDSGIKTEMNLEKESTLKCTNSIKNLIENEGINVLTTRDVDIYISQEDRVGYANRRKGNLFISVHTNFSFSNLRSGTEIYIFEGKELEEPPTLIRWEEVPLKYIKMSTTIAQKVAEHFRNFFEGVRVKKAKLYPLLGLDMPGLVVEIDYLSNSSLDESLLIVKCESFAKSLISAIKNIRDERR